MQLRVEIPLLLHKERTCLSSPNVRESVKSSVTPYLIMILLTKLSVPGSSPIVVVKMKDVISSFCVDYRILNSVTIKDSHPLPRTDDTINALSGNSLFSTRFSTRFT